jgi:transcriptional regulator MraZ
VFRGRYEHAIDGKGRTSLPSRFREALAGLGETRLILTTGFEPCVVAYPIPEWNAFEAKVAALPQFDPSVTMLRRVYISSAMECDVDKLGRILIPATLRKHAELTRELLWTGMGPTLELWDKDRHDSLRRSVVDDPEKRQAMVRRLAELGL